MDHALIPTWPEEPHWYLGVLATHPNRLGAGLGAAVLAPGLAEAAAASRIAEVLLRETSSIGVRFRDVARTERPRRVLEVHTPYGPIPVKISEGPYGPPQLKPEFDACVRAANAAGVPVREVIAAAVAKARA